MDEQQHVLRGLNVLGASCQEIFQRLESLSDWQQEAVLLPLESLLQARMLWLLRQASRTELHHEALVCFSFLESEHGAQLRQAEPERYGRWEAWAELLSDAADSQAPAAVESILLSYPSHGKALLEYLARRQGAAPRAELREALQIDESRLSHMLKDFEAAELILRHKPPGVKQVMVKLAAEGRKYVQVRILPPWLESFLQQWRLCQANQALPDDPEQLASDWRSQGASEAVIAMLSEALRPVAPSDSAVSLVVPSDTALSLVNPNLKAMSFVQDEMKQNEYFELQQGTWGNAQGDSLLGQFRRGRAPSAA